MVDKEKQYKRQSKWRAETKEQVVIYLPKGTRDKWKAKAEKAGKSLNEYIKEKVEKESD